MYFYLKGFIALQQKDSIVVECNGVGYEVTVPHPDAFELGTEQTVYTAFYVREDEQYLVGFKTFEEKTIFNKLIQVKGVGPKTAIACLGGTTPNKLVEAIDASDLLFLKKLPGIGPKAASQIILDLRGKITYSVKSLSGDKNLDEAIEGLKSLGFKLGEINNAFTKITERNLSTEEYIRLALPLLRRKDL